jgi:uncharacterized membrane protein
MTTVRDRYRALFERGESTERIEFFSDAVFAIAMTLLVLDIRLPSSAHDNVAEGLVELVPEIFAYVLSFGLIALNWMSHHRKFRVITGFDTRLMQLNLLLLLLVAFLPFPTSVLAETEAQVGSVVLYAATVAAISLAQLALWVYARHASLLAPSVDRGVFRYLARSLIITPAVFLLSIVIAFVWAPDAAMYSWLLLIPASIIGDRVALRRD